LKSLLTRVEMKLLLPVSTVESPNTMRAEILAAAGSP
jgi:hypothetical protein